MSSAVPESWISCRLGDGLKESTQKTSESNQFEVLSVTKDGMRSQKDYFKKQIASEDNSGYKIVCRGQLVFGTMNLWMGSLDVIKNFDKGIVSPAYKVFSILREYCDIDFMSYFLKSDEMLHKYLLHSEQGASIVRRSLDLSGLLDEKIDIPLLPEQKKIASILTSVDEVIENTQKQIDKLQDLKKATMNELLTKGIGHTEFKDSELGRIPKSWEVTKLDEFIGSLTGGVSVNSENRVRVGSELGVLKTSCISNGQFFPNEHKTVVEADVERVSTPVEAGTILFSRMNTPNLVGESGFVENSFPNLYLPDRLWSLKLKDNDAVSVRWLSWLLVSRDVKASISSAATGTSGSMKNISKPNLFSLKVRKPPLKEQFQISEIINAVNRQLGSRVVKLQKLQSLKKSLMQDLLTGKVRVSVN